MNLQVFWPTVDSPQVKEVAYSYDFCRKFSQSELPNGNWVSYHPEQSWQWPDSDGNKFICIVSDPQLVIPRLTWDQLLNALLLQQTAVVAPVYNISPNPKQVAELPGVYTTVSTFLEIAQIVHGQHRPATDLTQPYDPSCLICRGDLFPSNTKFENHADFISRLPEEAFLIPNALVHRFGSYGEADRSDLVAWIPPAATDILDIGCGRGWLGKHLAEERPHVQIVGVESNPAMASQAQKWYREVFVAPVEDFTSSQKFDCIVCGDILEHLENPWQVVERLTYMLRPSGCLVASVPNAGHWSLVRDLAQGRFDYLPYGLTCITHIRWFTEATLREMIEQAGLQIDKIEHQVSPPTPQGEKFIKMMVNEEAGNDKSLRAHGLIVRGFAPGYRIK